MNSEEILKTTELDRQVANSQLQMLKAALPYVSGKQQRFFAVASKALELRNTMQLFQESDEILSMCEAKDAPKTPFDILDIIKNYGTAEDQSRIDFLQNMLQAMKFYQQLEQLQATAPPPSFTDTDPERILKMLKQNMNPEDQSRMEMFRQMSRIMSMQSTPQNQQKPQK